METIPPLTTGQFVHSVYLGSVDNSNHDLLSLTVLKDAIARYRERELAYPTHGHVSSRLPKTYETRLRSLALRLETSPSTLMRFLAHEGAKQHGIDLLEVM